MNLNPLGIGLAYYNNWQQEDDREFILFSFEIKCEDRVWVWTAGIIGVGFALVLDLS